MRKISDQTVVLSQAAFLKIIAMIQTIEVYPYLDRGYYRDCQINFNSHKLPVPFKIPSSRATH